MDVSHDLTPLWLRRASGHPLPVARAPQRTSRSRGLSGVTRGDYARLSLHALQQMRNAFVAVAVLSLGIFPACVPANSAETSRPNLVTLVTHSSPGGGSDVFLRTMAPHLSRIMKKTVVVDNMQGGSGARAMAVLASAKPDGGMFYATTPTFIYTSLMSRPSATYQDLEPLVNMFYDPEVLFTAADSNTRRCSKSSITPAAEAESGARQIPPRSNARRCSG